MNDYILCQLNLFDMDQKVYIATQNEYKVAAISAVKDLGRTIATLGAQLNINKAHLFGHSDYITNIISDIKQTETTYYGNRSMEIEVN